MYRFIYDKGNEELNELVNTHRKDQINWLIELGQYKFREMSESEVGIFFHNEFFRWRKKHIIGENLALYALPLELAEQYYAAMLKINKNSSGRLSEKDLTLISCAFARPFLAGLSSFVVQLKHLIETGSEEFDGIDLETANVINLGRTMDGVFRLDIGGSDPKGLGAVILCKLLDGYSFDSLKNCPTCDTLFFYPKMRKQFCSRKCAEKANEKRQADKPDYKESRKMITRKAYLKNKKGLTDQQIIQKWREEGISKEWIERLFTKKKLTKRR